MSWDILGFNKFLEREIPSTEEKSELDTEIINPTKVSSDLWTSTDGRLQIDFKNNKITYNDGILNRQLKPNNVLLVATDGSGDFTTLDEAIAYSDKIGGAVIFQKTGDEFILQETDTDAILADALQNEKPGFFRQALINGGFEVCQRYPGSVNYTTGGTPTYTADRWFTLNEGSSFDDWAIAASSFVGVADNHSLYLAGAPGYINCYADGGNQQILIAQILEAKDSVKLRGKTLSFSWWALCDSAIPIYLRAYILSWTGAADSPDKNLISTWNSSGIDPVWSTNWTQENIASSYLLTTTWQEFKLENVNIDSTDINNIAVVIYIDNEAVPINTSMYVANVQLNVGSVAIPFQPKSFEEELRACQRYYEKSYDYATVAGTNTGLAANIYDYFAAANSPFKVNFQVQKRTTAPTLTVYDMAGTSGRYTRDGATSTVPLAVDDNGNGGFKLFTEGTAQTRASFHWTADAEL